MQGFPSSMFYLLGGCGKLRLPNISSPPPNVFPEKKNQNLFQIVIIFKDYTKESVKLTNVQKCNLANPKHYLFKIFQGSMPLDPPTKPKKIFLAAAWLTKIF